MGDNDFNEMYAEAADEFGEPHGVDRPTFHAQARHNCYESCQDGTMSRMFEEMARIDARLRIQNAYN